MCHCNKQGVCKTKRIPRSKLQDHLRHGDKEGKCNPMRTTCTGPNAEVLESLSQVADGFQNMSRADFRDYVRANLWDTVLEEIDDLGDVPTKYFNPKNYSFDDIMNGFSDFILDGKLLSPQDFIALQEEFNVTYISRRLIKEEESVSVSRNLVTSQECQDILKKATLDLVVFLFSLVGIRQYFGRRIVNGIAASKNFGPAFQLTWVRAGGVLNWEYFVGATITFFTNLKWQELENSIRQLFGITDMITVGLSLLLELLAIYSTGGWALAAKIGAMLPTIASLFSDVMSYTLQKECFGELRSDDCDGFQKSGGQGTTTSVINMKQTSGDFQIWYEMYKNPDEMEVTYEDKQIFWTGGLVSDSKTVDLSFSGSSQLIKVVMNAPNAGTEWEFSVSCPA